MARKRRKPPRDPSSTPSSEPVPLSDPVSDIAERIPGLTTADRLPQPENTPPAELPTGEPQPAFVDRHRPTGPRQRQPHEPRALFVSLDRDFRFEKEPGRFVFIFQDPPSREVKDRLEEIGFRWSPEERLWHAPRTQPIGEQAQRFAAELGGKLEGYGR